MHFWQNDRDLLRATVVTRGVQRALNKSQHTKLTLEKKILPPLLPGFELATFRSRVQRSYQQAIPAPQGMDRPGVRQVPEGSGDQGKMERTGFEIICGARASLTVKG